MKKITDKWIERAHYDLESAEAMFKACRYLYVAFLCQQTLEKMLKAQIINQGGEILRSHNLVRLAELSGFYISLPNKDQDFLANLSPFAIEARYGDYKNKLSEIIDRKTAQKYLLKTQEIYQWLKEKIKP